MDMIIHNMTSFVGSQKILGFKFRRVLNFIFISEKKSFNLRVRMNIVFNTLKKINKCI